MMAMNTSTFDQCEVNGTLKTYGLSVLSNRGFILAELILAVFIALGNILVLVAYGKFQELQTSMNIYLVSLALSDLTIALIVLPAHVIVFIFPIIQSMFFTCMLRLCIVVGSLSTSAMTLCIIAVDRYLAIEKPLVYNTMMTARKAKRICFASWFLTYSFAFSPLLGWNAWTPCQGCLSIIILPAMYFTLTVVFFTICITSVGIVNLRIFITANRVSNSIQSQAASYSGQESPVKKTGTPKVNMKALKTLSVMFGVFALCNIPYAIFILWEIYFSGQKGHAQYAVVRMVTVLLTFVNSGLNPIIYNHSIPEFNRAFRKLLRLKSKSTRITTSIKSDRHR